MCIDNAIDGSLLFSRCDNGVCRGQKIECVCGCRELQEGRVGLMAVKKERLAVVLVVVVFRQRSELAQ